MLNQSTTHSSFARHLRRSLLGLFGVAALLVCFSSCKQSTIPPPAGQNPPPPPTSGTINQKAVTPVTIKGDPTKFTHKSHEKHVDGSAMACEECHRREENINKALFPGHSACISCHLNEFTVANAGTQGMCIICHSNLDTIQAPQRDFPPRKSYTVFFDPQQHRNHVAYSFPTEVSKKADCAFCHPTEAKGVAIAFPNHPECYSCHTAAGTKASVPNTPHEVKPGALGPGECATCHLTPTEKTPVVLLQTKMTGKSYNYKFTHKSHEKLAKCEECHNLDSTYNTSQVAVPKAKAHLQNKTAAGQGCFTCHNDKRAFGDGDAAKCTKCHSPNQLLGAGS
ncbi:MAG: cytochrome c3 family protein [Blastocatellia bacterium]|nr:cytochrome c3 family protein [Blastocatellia bacterium]